MRHDQGSFRLVPSLSLLPMDDLGPVIDLVDWSFTEQVRHVASDHAPQLTLVLRLASVALDRIVEIAGKVTLATGPKSALTLPVSFLLAIAPGQQKSVSVEIPAHEATWGLHVLDGEGCGAALDISHVTYEDGSIERFGS